MINHNSAPHKPIKIMLIQIRFFWCLMFFCSFELLSCKSRSIIHGSTPGEAVRNFFTAYVDQKNIYGYGNLNDILKLLTKEDADYISAHMIEYNSNENEDWLAKFRTDSGKVIQLMRDGSVK